MRSERVEPSLRADVEYVIGRIRDCDDSAISFRTEEKKLPALERAAMAVSVLSCDVRDYGATPLARFKCENTVTLGFSPSISFGAWSSVGMMAKLSDVEIKGVSGPLTPTEELALADAAQARMLKCSKRALAMLHSDFAGFNTVLRNGRIDAQFAEEWKVTGDQLAPRPEFRLAYKGETFILALHAPRLWFPVATLAGSVTMCGLEVSDSIWGRPVRALYDTIRALHPETAPHLNARWVPRAG
ncbi:MAG: hypothetical protein K1X79_12250 [Oligoflexia bacterium]|nr:hypothetical protein [Oligoflexia bacterium]